MRQELNIKLPARVGVPETSIHIILHTKSGDVHDRETLIMVPGGPGNDYTMYDTPDNSLAEALLPIVNIILFDPRGCGSSEISPVEYCSLEHYIDDIEAIRTHLKLSGEKFMVFGQSYGSLGAIGYAIKYPKHLKKLLIIGGVASHEFLEEAKRDLNKIGTPEQIRFAQKLWNGSFTGTQDEVGDYYRVMSPLYSYSFVPMDDAPLNIPCNIDILNYGWGQFLKTFDFRPNLSKIKCPTLILWGENEWIMNKNQINQLHQGIPHSKLITYKECSHMLWIDQWDRFLKDAYTFLKT
jgi:proline iminopeptidase